MKFFDTEIRLNLKQEFTSVKSDFENLIAEKNLQNANIVCWVPHEVSSLIQLGWEDGLVDDMRDFLRDKVPAEKWLHHDEPGTPFRHNFHEHARAKLMGSVSLTLIVKDGALYLGKYQGLYFYSPVFKNIPEQKIFCRVLVLDE